jgi:hypothetical protein
MTALTQDEHAEALDDFVRGKLGCDSLRDQSNPRSHPIQAALNYMVFDTIVSSNCQSSASKPRQDDKLNCLDSR